MSGYVCQKCPYASDCNDLSAGIPHLASDALKLLKEQQETIAGFQGTIYKLNAELEKQPDIVRCKHCKHLFDGEHTKNCCDVLMEKTGWLKEISVSPDWFCADGERR